MYFVYNIKNATNRKNKKSQVALLLVKGKKSYNLSPSTFKWFMFVEMQPINHNTVVRDMKNSIGKRDQATL